jgi:hypothetical protein
MIKKYKWFAIGGLLVALAVGYVVCDKPRLTDRINYWRGQYEEQKKVAMADAQIKLATIAELEGQNALLQSSIDSANTIIAQKEQENAQANTDLANARKGWGAYTAEAQAKLKELDDAWATKFDILLNQDKEKDKIIFSLTKQYQAALSIGEEYKGLWNQEKSLRLKAETGLNLQDKRILVLGKQVRLTKVLSGTAVAVVACLFLLKK